MGTQFAHELVSPFLLLISLLIGGWNGFLENNFEIIENVEENKVFRAKLDYKRTSY